VADDLGTAVLRVVVDDEAARRSLGALRKQIEESSRVTIGTGGTRGGGGRAASESRSAERRTQAEDRRTVQLDRLDADLARVREQRIAAERRALLEQRQSDKRRKEQADRQSAIASNALIGGAFPLLFGQGLGAAVGGAAGGAAGGVLGGQFGFGGSLVGTAIGAQFDAAIQKLSALGKALDDPIKQFATLQQNASLSSKQQERYIEGLIAVGRNAEAAAVIQQDLIETFGSLQAAQAYNSQIDELNRAWSRATTVLASFVVGPLANFLSSITNTGTQLGTAARFEQLAQTLSPEQYFRVRERATAETGRLRDARAAASGTPPLLRGLVQPTGQEVTAGLREGIKLADQILGVEKQRADVAARIAAAQVQTTAAFSDQFRLIDAQTQGYERQALIQEKQAVLNERNRKLLELPENRRTGSPEALRIQQDAALGVYRINQQIAQLDKDRLATSTLQIAQFRLQSTELERQFQQAQRIAAIGTGAGVTVARDNARFIGGLDEQIRKARQAEADIAAQISAEQLRGGDQAAQRIAELGRQQVIAAQTTRNLLFEGATQLRDAGQQLARNLRDAVTNFTAIRSDPQGLNRFLSPQAQANRAQGDFRLLLPQFRNAQAQFERLTGERAPEFTGTTAGVNAAIRDFINAVGVEDVAQQQVIQTTQALVTTNESLAQAQRDLAVATNALALKDWNIYLNGRRVNGGSELELLPGAIS
jgi:hypothetical protein